MNHYLPSGQRAAIDVALRGDAPVVTLPTGTRESTAQIEVLHRWAIELCRRARVEATAAKSDPQLSDVGRREKLARVRDELLREYHRVADGGVPKMILADVATLERQADVALDTARECSAQDLALLTIAREMGDANTRQVPVARLAIEGVDKGDKSLALAILRAPALLDPLTGGHDPDLRAKLRGEVRSALLHRTEGELVAKLIEVERHEVVLAHLLRFALDGIGIECTTGGESPVEDEMRARREAESPAFKRMQDDRRAKAKARGEPVPRGA